MQHVDTLVSLHNTKADLPTTPTDQEAPRSVPWRPKRHHGRSPGGPTHNTDGPRDTTVGPLAAQCTPVGPLAALPTTPTPPFTGRAWHPISKFAENASQILEKMASLLEPPPGQIEGGWGVKNIRLPTHALLTLCLTLAMQKVNLGPLLGEKYLKGLSCTTPSHQMVHLLQPKHALVGMGATHLHPLHPTKS